MISEAPLLTAADVVRAYEAGKAAGRVEMNVLAEGAILRWVQFVQEQNGNFLRVQVPVPPCQAFARPWGESGQFCGRYMDIPVEHLEFSARIIRGILP